MADQGKPKRVKPISLNDIQQMFIDTNARLDRAYGVPDALDHFIQQENPRNDDSDEGDEPEPEPEPEPGLPKRPF
jgi:hypothetical protein